MPDLSFVLSIAGKELRIAHDSVYRYLSYSGIESTEIEIDTITRAQLPGAFIQSKRVGGRTISIIFSISDKKRTEALRHWLISFLSPYSAGNLYVTRSGITRVIDVTLTSRPNFMQNNIHDNYLNVQIDLFCADPYFRDTVDTEFNYKKSVPLLTFPFNSVKNIGISSGIYRSAAVATMINDGDVPVGIKCVIKASGGDVVNPGISCGSEYITLICVLQDGDTAEIITRAGEKTIRINGETRYLYEVNSVFFELPVGESVVHVNAESGVAYLTAEFSFARKWLGV